MRHFDVILQKGIVSKINVGLRARKTEYRGEMTKFVWDNYLHLALQSNRVNYIEKPKGKFTWSMTTETARATFDYGERMQKTQEQRTFFMDRMIFTFNSNKSSIKIQGVIIIYDAERRVYEGYDLYP